MWTLIVFTFCTGVVSVIGMGLLAMSWAWRAFKRPRELFIPPPDPPLLRQGPYR